MSEPAKLDILGELQGLYQQATKERSHYYTGAVVQLSISEIERLRAINAELGADVKRKGDANLGLLYQNLGYAEMNEELRAINAELLAALEMVEFAESKGVAIPIAVVFRAIAKAKGE